ncbi:MAG: methyl-accepting chemotaxis protein [Bryobacteraceae bacterium]
MTNQKLSTRVGAGFVAVTAILAGIATIAASDAAAVVGSVESAFARVDQERFLAERQKDHLNWVKGLSLTLLGGEPFQGQLDPAKCKLGLWLYDEKEQARQDSHMRSIVAAMEATHKSLHQSAERILARRKAGDEKGAAVLLRTESMPALQATGDLLEQLRLLQNQAASTQARQLMADARKGRMQVIVFGCTGLLVALTVSLLLVRYLNRRLRSAVSALSESSTQAANAARQVASFGEALARDATSEASSIEQTSASSQEIQSMARKNRDSSATVAQLLAQSERRFSETNQSLDATVAAMVDIHSQSLRVSQIIRTIDEIAFQTNILALNAAVEAARAGEAGMGFAVVAEAVRDLAHRCASAAKDTEDLIQGSIQKTDAGKEKVSQVAASMRTLAADVAHVRTLVDDVNRGSEQQVNGIEQIAKAISQIEQVTQRTAANAEESSASAVDLTDQAQRLSLVVEDLKEMVGQSA